MGSTIVYRSEPTNIFLITSTRNIYIIRDLFAKELLKIETRLRYLVVYLGSANDYEDYMWDKVANWDKPEEVFSQIADKEPQVVFAGITHSLYHECSYTKRVIYHPVEKYFPLDREVDNSIKTAIFDVKQVQDNLLQIASLPVKMAGFGIFKTTSKTPLNHNTSRDITAHHVEDILGEVAFDPSTDATTMTSGHTSFISIEG